MRLGKKNIEKMIKENDLVIDYENLDKQLTANGIDFRVAAIIEVVEAGTMHIKKDECKKPKFGNLWVMENFENVVDGVDCEKKEVVPEGFFVELKKETPYLFITCESVNTPKDYNFTIQCRSSLFRMTQSVLATAFGEAGYRGVLTLMVAPLMDTGVDIGVRFCQIVFSKLDTESHYEEQKETNYQDGKVI